MYGFEWIEIEWGVIIFLIYDQIWQSNEWQIWNVKQAIINEKLVKTWSW